MLALLSFPSIFVLGNAERWSSNRQLPQFCLPQRTSVQKQGCHGCRLWNWNPFVVLRKGRGQESICGNSLLHIVLWIVDLDWVLQHCRLVTLISSERSKTCLRQDFLVLGDVYCSLLAQSKQIIKDNGYEDVIEVIQAKLEDITELPGYEKVDIIISEWMVRFFLRYS